MKKTLLLVLLCIVTYANNYGDSYVNSANVNTTTIYNYSDGIIHDTILITDTVTNYINGTDTTHGGDAVLKEYTHVPISYIELTDNNNSAIMIYDDEQILFKGVRFRVDRIFIKTYPLNVTRSFGPSIGDVNNFVMVNQSNGFYDIKVNASRFTLSALDRKQYIGNRLYKYIKEMMTNSTYIKISFMYVGGQYSPIYQYNTIDFNKLLNEVGTVE